AASTRVAAVEGAQIQATALLNQALAAHRQGNLSDAKDRYCDVLRLNPSHPDAWHMLGMVLFQGGEPVAALDCLGHAFKFSKGEPPVQLLVNEGLVRRALGQLDQARMSLEQVVARQPDYAEGWNSLGTVLLEQHHYAEAEQAFRRTLELQPTHNHGLTNLGNALQHQRRYNEAHECYQAAVDRSPQDSTAVNNLGTVLRSLRRYEEAAETFRRAVELDPHSESALVNLARSLDGLGHQNTAIELFERYVADHPGSVIALHHLGNSLADAGRHHDAVARYTQALDLDPQYAFAYSSLGRAHLNRGDAQAAAELFRRALELRPDMHETHSCLLFMLSNDDMLSPRELFAEHVRWGELHGHVDFQFSHAERSRQVNRRLKIGYVSPDLREHAVARFFMPVLAQHDPTQVEVFCYAHVHREDETTAKLKSLTHHWRSTCGLSYLQVAELIQADQIDILVDLAGHTAGNRLLSFAYRPAPVQVSWLGYPNTTGLPAMDYRLTSEIQDPASEESLHTEQLIRLPLGTNCYEAPTSAPAISPLPFDRNGFVTFGSLHRPQKISAPVFDLWANVLKAVPNSRLRLFNTHFSNESIQHVSAQLTGRGIAAERFSIGTEVRRGHYLTEYDEIDVALDVFPWNGGTTTREALWMGVPVIGLLGDRRSSRGTAATLHYAGVPELIAHNWDEYVEIACKLAVAPPELQRYRQTLREQARQTICDAARFTQSLEAAYRQIWQTWCAAPTDHSTSARPEQISQVQTDMAPRGIQTAKAP
ncbi:MAG: tetratricopeptide repeat protein, partial [Planctomycetales bacterium]|nr:tetratricopeptide repeat protein [Planctomycetales bacterium]